MHFREHPIVWVIGATRSCKTAIAEYGVSPLGFKFISTATYFRERYAKPDTYSKEFVFSLSQFSAECLSEEPDCHLSHLERVLKIDPQPYVIEGERNPAEFAKLYDPKKDMVIFVNRTDMDKYDTTIERGIPVIEQSVRWCVNNGIAPQDSVISLTFGGACIKAERFGKGDNPDKVIIEGEVENRVPESTEIEDRYPWIGYVNKIVSDAVKTYYNIERESVYDTLSPAVTSSRAGP